jgi:predicted lipid-binding transport protein (Tim44 family)
VLGGGVLGGGVLGGGVLGGGVLGGGVLGDGVLGGSALLTVIIFRVESTSLPTYASVLLTNRAQRPASSVHLSYGAARAKRRKDSFSRACAVDR